MIGGLSLQIRRISPRNGRILVSGLAMGAAFGCKSNLSIEETRTQAEELDDDKPSAPLFYGECTASLVQKPKVPYPAWDYNWDHRSVGRKLPSTAAPLSNTKTRHILLIRHGQYEQGFPDDHQQILTPLGRKQAEYTGQRLAKLMLPTVPSSTDKDSFVPVVHCRIKAIHVSGMARAKETARIIASHLGENGRMIVTDPDPLLNEALPAPIIPKRPDVGSLRKQQAEIRDHQGRIEEAFQKYIHRAAAVTTATTTDKGCSTDAHEFEVFVCHGNVIRYFLMRALQLPPEAWLRFSVFNCSITYLMVQPNGYVTARLVGDTGHLPYEDTTFSGSYGYNWAAAPTST
jgi:serine/threonine-protein phosphatase PGAM5